MTIQEFNSIENETEQDILTAIKDNNIENNRMLIVAAMEHHLQVADLDEVINDEVLDILEKAEADYDKKSPTTKRVKKEVKKELPNEVEELNEQLFMDIIDAKKPFTLIEAGVSTGKTYWSTNLETRGLLFLTSGNIIKAQTTMKHGITYNISSFLESFEKMQYIHGVSSTEAFVMAYNDKISTMLNKEDISSFNNRLSFHIKAVFTDEVHLYITEAGYRPLLSRALTLFKELDIPVIGLSASPTQFFRDYGHHIKVTKEKDWNKEVKIVRLPDQAEKRESKKEKGKMITPKKAKGFAKAQAYETIKEISEEYLKDIKKQTLIIYSENSLGDNRKIAEDLNKEFPDLGMVVMDRVLYDEAVQKRIDIYSNPAPTNQEEEELFDNMLKQIYIDYPFMSLFDEDQQINRPLIVSSFGKQGLNILDNIETAHIALVPNTRIRAMSFESKIQAIGRVRNAKTLKIYDLISSRVEKPFNPKNTFEIVKSYGRQALNKSLPYMKDINTILDNNVSGEIKKAQLDYLDSLERITLEDIKKFWGEEVVYGEETGKNIEFVNSTDELFAEIFRVVDGVNVYADLVPLYKDVIGHLKYEKEKQEEQEYEITPFSFTDYFPGLTALKERELFSKLKYKWTEHFEFYINENVWLNPASGKNRVIQYKVRKENPKETKLLKVGERVEATNSIATGKFPVNLLKTMLSVIPEIHHEPIKNAKTFSEKLYILENWFEYKKDTQLSKVKKRKYINFTGVKPLVDLEGDILLDSKDSVIKTIEQINAEKTEKLNTMSIEEWEALSPDEQQDLQTLEREPVEVNSNWEEEYKEELAKDVEATISFVETPNVPKSQRKYNNQYTSNPTVKFSSLEETLKIDGILNPFTYVNGKRNATNLTGEANLILLDVDNGTETIYEIEKRLKEFDYKFMISTTSDKTNLYKMRILFPVVGGIAPEDYGRVVKNFSKEFDFLTVDKAAFSPSLMLFTYKDSTVLTNLDGDNVDSGDFDSYEEEEEFVFTNGQKINDLKMSEAIEILKATPSGEQHIALRKTIGQLKRNGYNLNDIHTSLSGLGFNTLNGLINWFARR